MSNISYLEYSFSSLLAYRKSEQSLKHDKSPLHADITSKNDNYHSVDTPSFSTYSDSNASCSYSSLSGYDDELELAKCRLYDIIHLYQDINNATSKCITTTSRSISSEQEWHKQFLQLMSSLTHQAEQLETFSTDLLDTEIRMRQLIVLENSIIEQLYEQEKLYISRLEECHQVLERQTQLINYLDEISHFLPNSRSSFDSSSTTLYTKHRKSFASDSTRTRIQDEATVEKLIHRIRCELSLRIGGCVSTGCVMHSFQHAGTTEWIISGSGTTANLEPCRYTLHIRPGDHHRFQLLPRKEWIPDHQVNQCQSEDCSSHFTLFQRRHHCRKCGHIICQRHSMNRAPLLNALKIPEWHRVCNQCFDELTDQPIVRRQNDK